MTRDAGRTSRAFDDLGRSVEERWRAAAYDVAAFPEIAAESLRRSRLETAVEPADILRWVLETELPEQFDLGASFGEPPVTLFRTDRFFIQALFWYQGSTAIHHHGFSGAFLVLSGSSIHTRWSFVPDRRVNELLLFGKLTREEAGLIGLGAVERIDADLIHCVFHLDSPSVTVVVRTYSDFLGHPQYSYLRPHAAMYAPGRAPTLTRRLQAIRLAARINSPSLEEEVIGLLRRSDPQTAFFICEDLFSIVDAALFDRMLATLDVDRPVLDAVFAHARREAALLRARSRETDEELRFFLALLLTLDSRADVERLVRQRTGSEEPLETISQWVARLARAKSIEIPADAVNEMIFRSLLRGATDDAILDELSAEHGRDSVREQEPALRRQFALFRDSVLAPLFV